MKKCSVNNLNILLGIKSMFNFFKKKEKNFAIHYKGWGFPTYGKNPSIPENYEMQEEHICKHRFVIRKKKVLTE